MNRCGRCGEPLRLKESAASEITGASTFQAWECDECSAIVVVPDHPQEQHAEE